MMRQPEMPRRCERLIARGGIAVSLVLILWLVLATQCSRRPSVQQPVTGLIWNYVNASNPTYMDLPATPDPGTELYPDPTADYPVYLTPPCGTWNALGITDQEIALSPTYYGVNPCAQCHCNREIESYYWYSHGAPRSKCITGTGSATSRDTWLANPDGITIVWR